MSPRKMLVGALAPLLLVAAAQAQETNTVTSNSVGNPQLRDFELPGTRATPPAPPPEAATPPVTITAPPPPSVRAAPAPEDRAPVSRPSPRAAPPARAVERAPAPAASPTAPTPPVAAGPQTTLPSNIPSEVPLDAAPTLTPAPPVAEAPQAAAPAPAPSEGGIPWLYFGLAAAAALLGLFVLLKRRGRTELAEEPHYVAETPEPAPRPQPQPVAAKQASPASVPVPAPSPAPAPASPPSDIVGIRMRPWLEIEFKPARAAATPTEANVQFELTVRNTGTAPARNVRIEVRMFNAGHGQEQEIDAFYGEPIRERTAPALEIIPAKEEVHLTAQVAMPNENVRELNVQGRRLFIPTVAFNLVYDWGNGKSGQTSASYLVGREAETPTEKMGAFRLDLGPRLYRSVGQRPMSLARTV